MSHKKLLETVKLSEFLEQNGKYFDCIIEEYYRVILPH